MVRQLLLLGYHFFCLGQVCLSLSDQNPNRETIKIYQLGAVTMFGVSYVVAQLGSLMTDDTDSVNTLSP